MAHLQASSLYDVNGLVALVTGGGTGIGLQIARGLAANGARVYIASRRKNVVDAAASQHGENLSGKLIPLSLDVTDKQSILAAVTEIGKNEGKLYILVNNAGQAGPFSAFFEDRSAPENKDAATLGQALFNNESFEEWRDNFSVNVSSIFFVTMAFLGLLDKGVKDAGDANVINITSISGVMKLCQNHFAYNSSKAAAGHMTKMLSTELALKGIQVRVNAIAPGVWPTEMTLNEGGEFIGKEADKVCKGLLPLPAGRNGRDTEMAATALYLASRGGRYMNGQVLVIDGGFVATNPSTV